MKILVVFYSRTGSTRMVAEALSDRLGADREEIRDAQPRKGLFRGWWRSIQEARQGRDTQIMPGSASLRGYDLVVLGTPVWASSMSSPVRTWLNLHRGELKKIALFATQNGRGGEQVIAQIAADCGLPPVAELVVSARELASGKYEARVDEFAAEIVQKGAVGDERTTHPTERTAHPGEGHAAVGEYWSAEAHQGQIGW